MKIVFKRHGHGLDPTDLFDSQLINTLPSRFREGDRPNLLTSRSFAHMILKAREHPELYRVSEVPDYNLLYPMVVPHPTNGECVRPAYGYDRTLSAVGMCEYDKITFRP